MELIIKASIMKCFVLLILTALPLAGYSQIDSGKEAKLEHLNKFLRRTYDEFKEVEWIEDKKTTKYPHTSYIFSLYLGKSGDRVWPRLKIKYTGENWIFIEGYDIKTDNNKYTITPNSDIERDNSAGWVWEHYDFQPDESQLKMIEDIANSKTAKIRFSGSQSFSDRVINEKEKEALRRILEVYDIYN